MNIQEIIFPIDFSERSIEACPYVAAIAQRFGARLTLLHVVENLPPALSTPNQISGEAAGTEQQRIRALTALSAFQHQYIPHVPSEVCVLVGDPATAIAAHAGESGEKMVVMPTHGYGPFRQMLIGSVTAKVLHDAKCPVLTGPHLDEAIQASEWFSLRRILCAVSLNWETDGLLKHSTELARQLGLEMTAVHVVSPVEEGMLPLVDPHGPPLSPTAVRNTLQQALHRAGGLGGVCVTIGEVSREVARAARVHNADLVVIGRGGAPDLPGRLGSHTYGILRRAPCPVLCI
jgi:nucleotide-binding universal stress UspA family protein